jgi:hypothetical protein
MNQGIQSRPVPSPAPRPDSALLKYLPGGGAREEEEEGEYAVPVQVDFGRPELHITHYENCYSLCTRRVHYAIVSESTYSIYITYNIIAWCKQTDQNFYQLYFLFLPVLYRDHKPCAQQRNPCFHKGYHSSLSLSLSLLHIKGRQIRCS